MTPDLELVPARAQQQVQFTTKTPLVEAQPPRIEFVAHNVPRVAGFHQKPPLGEGNTLIVRRMPTVQVEGRREREYLNAGERKDRPCPEARPTYRDAQRNACCQSENAQKVPR